jgi:hypothetical protein
LPRDRQVFAVRFRPGIRRFAARQRTCTQPGPNLEIRRGHDELFLERLRDEPEAPLRVPFDPERLPDARERLRAELDVVPPERLEPRFEPRLVWRVLRLRELPDRLSPAPPVAPLVASCSP